MNLKKFYDKCVEELEKEKSYAKFSSVLIKNNKEFYLNFHDNEEKVIYSFLFDNKGNLLEKEKIREEFRELKDEDEIKEEEIEKVEKEIEDVQEKETKDFIISKKEGKLNLVEFDLKNQTIKEFEINENGKTKKQEFKFNEVFKFG